MAINIKYRPLKAFLLAVDTGSFTRAAARLGVTQPSFTALIHDLEEVLGVPTWRKPIAGYSTWRRSNAARSCSARCHRLRSR
ncbi:MAG: LysR family transcriptional regulator [Proteobacteria bacterium]|nr:LysR family transcriptional regulator [Pseudomonadota bacterium]